MKLSKKTLLVIAAGVFIILLASLGVVRFQQAQEQNRLNEQLSLAQSKLGEIELETLSSRQAELDEKLSQAASQCEEVEAILSQPIDSTTACGILFDIADAHALEVPKISSSAAYSEVLEGDTYTVISLNVTIQGDVPDLVSFVTDVNNYLATGVVKSVKISVPEPDSEEDPLADINLVVYTYQGD